MKHRVNQPKGLSFQQHQKDSPLVVVVGETGSGKSALGMQIAKQFNGEIISADSWAIYKGMDVGTAKPSLEEQGEIPHYEIDQVYPGGSFAQPPVGEVDYSKQHRYTAAVFQANTKYRINDINSRKKLPMIVGGTGLYVDSVLFDYSFGATGDLNERQKYNAMGLAELVGLVNERGYDTTAIDLRNKRRVVRLLETAGSEPSRADSVRPNTLVIGVSRPKNELRERIEKRTEIMFKQGLRKEVEEIAAKYGWDCDGMQGIGYKEFTPWHNGDKSMSQVKRDITRNTLALAKRQRTWFKRHQMIHWVSDGEDVAGLVADFLNSSS